MFVEHSEKKSYKVTFINEEKGLNATIQVRGDEYIFDAAEKQGIELPVSCRAGTCISCTGRLISGEVDQDHDFLKPNELAAGFILTCKAYALSDCVIETHQEEALLDL
ncbi:MAG: 2Fe-2S iron-sulfur cluster binding domain-containing protein [Gomphosphaeria aponina SAG 52.96 = DSM 107014]|uniref:2Fe-2S iron-sulfur cluster binding domain-containing protein n=1 Tax=Gomphosphaeria aponina SAG 52.96 = DSM 107014 TaxID=1521640 RepID=A0A941GMS3_9CHRO|nr:2Fe-2S iron-sulfur cluster binding domain-containing protein [Gomphosphaeria aponina SAG 52.96 = DSM 107014]